MVTCPGALSMAWRSVVRLGATWLGVELDAITEWSERVPAPESFGTA